MRLLGGALNGQVLWVEDSRAFVDVHLAAAFGVSRTLRYQIDRETASFVGESGAEGDFTDTTPGNAPGSSAGPVSV